jgi:hypothetical protein
MDENKIIKTYWEGPISNLERLSIKSFIANGHIVYVYTYDTKNMKSFDNNMVVLDAAEIMSRDKRNLIKGEITIASDFFRFYLLYKTGGWWMDLDTVLLQPLTTESPIVVSLHYNIHKTCCDLASSPLKIPKGHILAESLIRTAESQDFGKLRHALSVRLMNQEVYRLNLEKYILPVEFHFPFGYGEVHRLIEPKFGFDRITPNTISIHFFNHIFSDVKKIDKNKMYHPDSLYEYLKRKYL